MDTYVVRIYRPAKRASRLVLGVVERVGVNGLRRFSNFDELREILLQGNGIQPTVTSEERRAGIGK